MEKLTDLEYLKLNRWQKFLYKFVNFFISIPFAIWHFIKFLGLKIKDITLKIWNGLKEIVLLFINGSWKTKLSYVFMGFGNISRGQIFRGILFMIFEIVFIVYMILYGGHWIGKLITLGDVATHMEYDEILDVEVAVPGESSFKILLYGLLTVTFIVAFIYTWYINIKQNKISEEIIASGKKIKSGKDDLRSLVDDQFHKSLLALPVLGIVMFTVIPIIFMILVAFTNYDASHDGFGNLFDWVGLDNFNNLISWKQNGSDMSVAFGEILSWTLMWAIFATFTNYFLGMLVAIIINKKGIKFKKLWRNVLVLTIAIPQFISLLYVSNMFAKNGIVNGFLIQLGIVTPSTTIDFWGTPALARTMVILINIWIGIPYLVLIATGILMNIPQDLYESAKIDGANPWKQYTKITLPYMLFVTGPYLLTSFIGNINNFNVIYLLTGGGPTNTEILNSTGGAGYTDLLITWLFKMSTGVDTDYKNASVIGIMIFIIIAFISLVVYNLMPSTKNEEDFS